MHRSYLLIKTRFNEKFAFKNNDIIIRKLSDAQYLQLNLLIVYTLNSSFMF